MLRLTGKPSDMCAGNAHQPFEEQPRPVNLNLQDKSGYQMSEFYEQITPWPRALVCSFSRMDRITQCGNDLHEDA